VSPWQAGMGPHTKEAVVHVVSGQSRAAWSAGPSLSAAPSFGEGHHQPMAAPCSLSALWGHQREGLEAGQPATRSQICASAPKSRITPLGLRRQLGAKPDAGCRAGGWLHGTRHCCPEVSGYHSLLGHAETQSSKRAHLFTAGVSSARH